LRSFQTAAGPSATAMTYACGDIFYHNLRRIYLAIIYTSDVSEFFCKCVWKNINVHNDPPPPSPCAVFVRRIIWLRPIVRRQRRNYNAKRATSLAVFCNRRCIIVYPRKLLRRHGEPRKENGNDNEKKKKKMFLLFSRPAGPREISALSVVCERRRACASVGSCSRRRQCLS